MILSNACVLNERYTIQSVLGNVGPFDVNYLAWDLKEEKEVVVREYYPVHLAKRAKDSSLLEVHEADLFEYGLGAYSAEGMLLNKIEHTNVAQCQEHFKQNGTVYSVHHFVSGAPLSAYIKQQNGKISEEEALPIIDKILQALDVCHTRKLYHGGLSPRSILIGQDGNPMLIGFQAARFKVARECENLKEVVKPGYSAPEQVTFESEEGPWWDVYGSAATLFHMLTGQDLPHAKDGWSSSKIKVALYRDALLSSKMCDVLVQALAFQEDSRPASALALRDMILQTQQKTAQLHAGDGAPQFEVGYGAEVEPSEAMWQNGVDVTAAKIKIETEAQPVSAPLVEERELVDKEMPDLIPGNAAPQMLQTTNGREAAPELRTDPQPEAAPAPRKAGREQELEVLLTKMVKWQQVFVAFILGIVVIALLGLVGGVFLGPTLFQQSGTSAQQSTEAPANVSENVPSSEPAAMPAAASAAVVATEEENENEPAEEENIDPSIAETPGEPAEEFIEEPAPPVTAREESSTQQAERRPEPEPPAPEPERSAEPEPSSASLAIANTVESQEEEAASDNNAQVFFTDEELGVSTEPEAAAGEESPQQIAENQESLFNYYRVQGDSLMNQGFQTAALQWYQNALKYKPDDTYINQQIAVITDAFSKEEAAVRAKDSLEARLEQVRDQNGIFLLPDTPVKIVDEADVRGRIEYPIAAVNGGISGRVILRYMVDERGQIQDIRVVKGLGWGTEDVVIDLLRNAEFIPASFNGEPVKAWATFTTVFRLNR